MRSLGWPARNQPGVLIGRGDQDTVTHRGTPRWGHREGMAIYEPRREASGETNPADTLILDFPAFRTFSCLSHPVCGAWLWQPKQINTGIKCQVPKVSFNSLIIRVTRITDTTVGEGALCSHSKSDAEPLGRVGAGQGDNRLAVNIFMLSVPHPSLHSK